MDKEAASEFKPHLLYIVPSEGNSQKAVELVQRNRELQEEAWVQDVRLLQPPLPPWLDGVPIVVKRSTGEVYKGTACLNYLQKLCDTSPTYLAPGSGAVQSFHNGQSVGGMFESAAGIDTTLRDREGKVSEESLTEFQAAREEQDRLFSGNRPQDLVSTQS